MRCLAQFCSRRCRLRWLQVALAVLLVGSSAVAGWWQCWAASRSTAAVLSCSERESREQRAEKRAIHRVGERVQRRSRSPPRRAQSALLAEAAASLEQQSLVCMLCLDPCAMRETESIGRRRRRVYSARAEFAERDNANRGRTGAHGEGASVCRRTPPRRGYRAI